MLDAKKGITTEEAHILAVMREIRAEARPIRERVRQMGKQVQEQDMDKPCSDELETRLEAERARLEALRQEWRRWAVKRDEARQRRMVILGHITE